MADDDDKIIETEKIREAKKEYEELESVINRARETAEEREKERLRQLELQKQAASQDIEQIEDRIRSLERSARLQTGIEKKLIEEKIDGLKVVAEIVRRGDEDEIESYRNLMDKKIEENNRFLNALGRVRDAMKDTFDDIDSRSLQAMGSALGLSALFGVEIPKFKDLFQDFAVALDDARRSIVPFTTSIADANVLQNEFARVSDVTKIPITELGDTVGAAAGQFRMFALMTEGAQANLVGFHAQMKNMGVDSGSAIIESIMSDTGIKSSDDAIDIFKALTVQMKDLGVMPQTLADDYNKLIGTFAMFGDAAGMNIAKVSFQAQKAKVDTGAITGFADNFKGYSDAGRTAQTINAIFGRKIIDNPAELVSVFYTGGPAAALELVKRKIVSSGIDIEEMLGGAAGAARLQMLSQLGFGSAQAAKRLLTTDTTISPEDQTKLDEAMEGGPADESLQKRFDEIAMEMLTQADRVKQMNEELTTDFFAGLGVSLGDFGKMFDGMLEKLSAGFDRLTDAFGKQAGVEIPGLGGVDPDTGEMKPGTISGTVKSLIDLGAEQNKLNTSVEKATTSQNDNTEELKRLNTNLEKMAATAATEGPTVAAGGMASGTQVVLQVGQKKFDAYMYGAIDRFSKGA